MSSNVYSILHEGKLVEAFRLMKSKISSLNNWQLEQELNQAVDTYSTMLNYLSQGIEDPESDKIRLKLIQQTYSINDRANREIRIKKAVNERYCQELSSLQNEKFNFEDAIVALETLADKLFSLRTSPNKRESIQEHEEEETINQHDSLMGKVFNYIWTFTIWNKSDYAYFIELLSNDHISTDDKSVIISAVTFAAWELFDEHKLMFLFDAYLEKDNNISQRALVGLILLIIRYDFRLKYYPQVNSRFKLYAENKQFVTDCFTILMQLQYSKLTDTVSSKMVNDILPAIMKSQKVMDKSVLNLDAELTKNGENPEWHHNPKDDAKAEKKIRQMEEMQTEGADVYLSSFYHMKYSQFFKSMYHWICPFSFEYSDLYAIKKKLRPEVIKTATTLLDNAPFCDNDKFSFIHMVDSIQEVGQDVLMSQIQSQLGESGIDEILAKKKTIHRSTKHISKSYIFNLYRLYKVYPYHNQFLDPFNKALKNFSPLYSHILGCLLDNYDETLSLAEFMMRKELYDDALQLFRYLKPVKREEDADIWQKIGFCEQKMNLAEHALKDYFTAYDLQPDSKWTINHIAQTAFDCDKYETAIKFIDKILDKDEDNIKWLSTKVECLFGLNKFEESIPILYKLSYLDESSERIQEMLGWGLLMTNSTEKSEKIYKELLENYPTVKNYINLGHIYYIKGEIKRAYELYHKAYEISNSETEFIDKFLSLELYLDKVGLTSEKLQLMLDAVRIGDSENN